MVAALKYIRSSCEKGERFSGRSDDKNRTMGWVEVTERRCAPPAGRDVSSHLLHLLVREAVARNIRSHSDPHFFFF